MIVGGILVAAAAFFGPEWVARRRIAREVHAQQRARSQYRSRGRRAVRRYPRPDLAPEQAALMTHPHPFRFAAQLSTAPDATARTWADQARKVEDLGFSTLLMPDHFGDQLAPVPAMMAAADATTHLRIGTLVFDNDYRHPLVLAKEAATLDLLSDGRLELGLGAGWMRSDYEQSGITYDAASVRVDRFEEAVAIVTGLLESAGPFSFTGEHYTVTDHTPTPRPVQHPRPPIIIGGGGRRVLSIAGRHAEIVSINVNLKAGTGGPEAAPNASPTRLARRSNGCGPRPETVLTTSSSTR